MRTRTRITLAGLALGAALAGGVAWATIPADSGLYTACKLKATGTIRLIDPAGPSSSLLSRCTSYETQITWNQKGLKGDPGLTGANGTSGVDGKDGLAGPKGADGTNGVNGNNGPAGPERRQRRFRGRRPAGSPRPGRPARCTRAGRAAGASWSGDGQRHGQCHRPGLSDHAGWLLVLRRATRRVVCRDPLQRGRDPAGSVPLSDLLSRHADDGVGVGDHGFAGPPSRNVRRRIPNRYHYWSRHFLHSYRHGYRYDLFLYGTRRRCLDGACTR